MALAGVERSRERSGELADKAVVGDAKIAQLEGKANEVGDEVGGVNSPVNEDRAVDVGVVDDRKGRRL